jgi:hypothetical protein
MRTYPWLVFGVGLFLMLISGVFVISVTNISLDSQVIPTVVNGVVSSTSIMIGFSGTLIGLMLREMDEKRELRYRSRALITFAILGLVFSAAQLFLALLSLAGSNYIEAIRTSLFGLLFSFCTFFGLATMIGQKMLEG